MKITLVNTILQRKVEWETSWGSTARPLLDDVKELTGLRSNEMWREPEDRVAGRKHVRRIAVMEVAYAAQWDSRRRWSQDTMSRHQECFAGHTYKLSFLQPKLLHLIPTLCGVDVRWHTPPCSMVVHIISRQSLLFDVILYFVQPSSLRSSSLPSPLYFHYHRPPSYVVLLSSHHMPIPLQPSFLYFLCDFPNFSCPSYSFISDIVQLRNSAHPS